MNPKEVWNTYCEAELALLRPILSARGYTLDETQPHIAGERYLMQAVTTTSGKKLILLGKTKDNLRVVIKATCDADGIREILHERTCRNVLARIDFAGEVFHTPREIEFFTHNGFTVAIQEFIEQPCAFLERSVEEQFSFALQALKAQESAHATTWKHRALIENTFGIRDIDAYLDTFLTFIEHIKTAFPHDTELHALLKNAKETLDKNKITIEQYTGFLTHTDFVPHNIRITGTTIYLLDHSSLTFGNKYEGWARFINFMALHNPPLAEALITYVRENRTAEESVSLRMMRIYRLGEIIWYYIRTLGKSTDNLLALNTARVDFWKEILSHVLNDEPVPQAVILAYQAKRDSLRSEDEKLRQKGLN